MRTRVFRVLAGLLAVGMAWSLTRSFRFVVNDPIRSLPVLLCMGAATVTFALFALRGYAAVDRWLGVWYGVAGSTPASQQETESGEETNDERPANEGRAAKPGCGESAELTAVRSIRHRN